MWIYIFPIMIILIVLMILYYEKQNKIKRYWIYKNINRNEAIQMLDVMKEYLNRSVLIETISSKYYGVLDEVNDEYISLISGTNERDIVKIEFIVAVSIMKVNEKKKKRDK